MTPRQWLQLAVEHHQAGRLPQAQEIYRQILEGDPENADALRYLGLMAQQLGQHEDAVQLIEKAHRSGRPNPHSLNTLGMAYAASGRLREAKRCFTKALGMKADYADAHGNLGTALRALGQLKDAEPSYRRALALDPDSAEAHFNFANLLVELRRPQEAEDHFRRALALRPHYVQAQNNLGNALMLLARPDEAERCFRAVISLEPTYVQAHHNLGNLLKDLGRLDEAEHSYRAALAIDGRLFETASSLGNLLHSVDRFEEAAACHRQAIALQPDVAAAHYNLGNSLAALDRCEEAASSYRQAVMLEPNLAAARWALTMVQLPAVYEDDAQPQERRIAFAEELDRLAQWVKGNASADLVNGFVQQPFHLAYQDANNRDLLAKYGTLCCSVMERWRASQRFVAPDKPRDKLLKLGIASAHIHAHSVWEAIVKGWLDQLDPERVEFHLFHLGSVSDEETEFAKARAAHFEHGPHSLREWVDAIAGQGLDALAFPEIAMHTLTAQLASLRLAPVQFASWGHPETTGIPTVDYYVSAQGFEAPDAQENYSERLVPLPNLGCFYQPHSVTPVIPDLAALGISESGALLLCCGTPFKYAPSYDRTLTAIAHELGSCQFVFFADRALPFFVKLRRRLQLSFERAGLDFERHVVFAPWQPRPQFYGLLKHADVFLDTVGFSGFNTAMQAVDCSLPIVARQGRFMRGRFASAILKRMQLDELVATSESGYVQLAVRLARDVEYRHAIRARIESSRDILYEDVAPMGALQEFLVTACKRWSS